MASAVFVQNARDPNADSADFRNALGCFATGVTIVTCRDGLVPKGIVANSFASVSLAPPLVLWSPAKASRRYAAFVAAQTFSIISWRRIKSIWPMRLPTTRRRLIR